MRTFIVAGVLSIVACAPVAAQVRLSPAKPARVFVSVDAGMQAASGSPSEHFELPRNAEMAGFDVRYPARAAVLIDGSAAYMVWRQLGIGAALSRTSRNNSAPVTASIPHPLLFEHPRAIEGVQPGITRSETAAHLEVVYAIPASSRLLVLLSAGPSFVNVEQDVVTDVQYDETYPFDSAAFRAATAQRTTASATGFHTGLDICWLRGHFGFGGLVRFTHASVTLDTVDDRRLPIDAGGLQIGAGVRIAF